MPEPACNMFTFDAHLDLSMNAIEWNRDLTRTVHEIRQREVGRTDKVDRARGTVALPDLRRGQVGIVVATQIARFVDLKNPLPGWHSPEIAYAMMGINAVKGVEIGAGFKSIRQRESANRLCLIL